MRMPGGEPTPLSEGPSTRRPVPELGGPSWGRAFAKGNESTLDFAASLSTHRQCSNAKGNESTRRGLDAPARDEGLMRRSAHAPEWGTQHAALCRSGAGLAVRACGMGLGSVGLNGAGLSGEGLRYGPGRCGPERCGP